MKKTFRMKKPLAWILSLSLLVGCFGGLSSVSNASEPFTVADFEGSSPFVFNGKTGDANAQYFTYAGNSSLVLNDGGNNKLPQRLPSGTLSGTAMNTDGGLQRFAYVVGNEGYRPTKVSFQFKVVGRAGNTHVMLYPLTFAGKNGNSPIAKVLSMDLFISSSKKQLSWARDYTGLMVPKNAAGKNVFTSITDVVYDQKNPNKTIDTTPFTFSDKLLDVSGSDDSKAANAALIHTSKWYKVELNYDWTDNNKVAIDAVIIDGTTERHNQYTVTYDPSYIEEVYNFGIISINDSNPVFIDNLTYYSENPKTGDIAAPDQTGSFRNKYASLLAKTVDDITLQDESAVKNALADYALFDAANQARLLKEKQKLDEFSARIEELKEGSTLDEYKQYLEAHKIALSLMPTTVKLEDEAKVKAALDAYKLLSDDTKELLSEQKTRLDQLKKIIDVLKIQKELNYTRPTPEEGFLGYPRRTGPGAVEDFEDSDSIKIWTKIGIIDNANGKPLINGGEAFDMEIVKDPSDSKNHVLELKGIYGAAVPYDFALPAHASLTHVKFDITTMETCGYDGGYVLYPAYKDAQNYVRVELGLNSDGTAKYRWGGMINGVSYSKGSGSQGMFAEGVDYKKGFTVEYNYTPASLQVNVVLTSKDVNANGEHAVTSFTFNYGKADWSFALASRYNVYAQNTNNAKSVYYDNLSASFVEGDWDDDLELYRPVIYFTENTLIKGGDTAMLYGANLGDTVASVEMVALPDGTSKVGYILQDRYNKKAASADYTLPSSAKEAFESAGTPVTLEILQKTAGCINVGIPSTFKTGIYALKVNPKVATEAPVYVYMNAPVIDFTVGNNGKTVEAGSDLRVIGKNLSLTAENKEGYTDANLINELGVRAWIKGANGLSRECTVSAVQSRYSVSVRIPANIPAGEYEVYIYNGFGDNSAWSAPVKFTVAGSPWAQRSDRIFNVLDYGADPAAEGNDTPAIIAALTAASQNPGGGTVYLPDGWYVIYYAIPLPQNVRLMGGGIDETRIIFNYTPFDFGQLPTGMFITEGNNEISDLAIYSVREFPVVTSSVPNIENVYIHDTAMRVHKNQGVLGQGGGGKPLKDPNGKSLETLFSEENSGEGKRHALIFKEKVSNLKVTNNIIEGTGSFIFAKTSYSVIADNDTNVFEMRMNKIYDGESNIFENNKAKGYLGGALEGNGIYIGNNEMGNVDSNNREIITTDGKPNYSPDDRKGMIRKIEATAENEQKYQLSRFDADCCYQFADGSTYRNENYWKDSNLMVTQGQGEMQVRTIVYSKDDLIVVDSPFVVEPNRNSRVQIEDARQNYINVNNDYVNGGKVGTFGVHVGAVYDGNTFDSCLGYNHVSQGDGVVWYVSMVNTIYHNGSFWHTSGSTDVTGETTGLSGVSFESRSAGKNGFNAIVVRNIEFYKGAKITFINPNRIGFGDFLIDNCTIDDAENGIVFNDKESSVIDIDGLTISGLVCTNVATPIKGDYLTYTTKLNEYKSPYIVIYYGARDDSLGDVNNDGKVTIMDAVLIRSYLVGEIDLIGEMKQRADVNRDGNITIIDALRIRLYLVNQATLK